MRVLLLGATGSIGTAITGALQRSGHQVTGLARSQESAARVAALGGTPLMGDLRNPQVWAPVVKEVDAVIQAAATFDRDMADTDSLAMAAILGNAAARDRPLRLLYTGGCWLYGATGDRIADEASPKRPISSFAWMVSHSQQILRAAGVSSAVVHPGMVYHADGGGAFERYLTAARAGQPIEVWGSLTTRWPLVQRDDVAAAYRCLLERSDLTGEFNLCAQSGVTAREIITEIARRTDHTAGYVVRTLKHVLCKYGALAEGPTLDQQMNAEKLKRLTGWQPEHSCFSTAGF